MVDLGLDADGAMEVPQGPDPVGWYTGSPTPGERGPSVLAAHQVWNGVPGAIARVAGLRAGDRVEVGREDGSTAAFAVTRVVQYGKEGFPTAEVYGNTEGPELRLITCAGAYDARRSRYLDNVVVYARLVPPA